MAILEEKSGRESTKREMIDQQLLVAAASARQNEEAAKRLRSLLLSAPSEEQRPDRPARPGWFGEVQDGLEATNDCLEETAKILQEILTQVSSQVPTPTFAQPPSLAYRRMTS